MAKTKTQYACHACGGLSPKWAGQCPECGAWNSLNEEQVVIQKRDGGVGYAGVTSSTVTALSSVEPDEKTRWPTGFVELDRVLGGGLVPGAVVLLGGDPGIGKSTLLLQTVGVLTQTYPTLYVTGEESLQQISLRAHRLGYGDSPLQLLAEVRVEQILSQVLTLKPKILVIDSIQTMATDRVGSAPGSVSQLRECSADLVRFAKQHAIAIFLVGHVTKEGALAGPRVLEHMVDTVLYFEGQSASRYRLLRAVKNRFGAVNELGVFAMSDKGLREVANPSAMLLSGYSHSVPGSAVMVTWEGTRPLLVEVQALVDQSHLANPRRVTLGLDAQRLALCLAVLHRHGGVATHDQDVFVNVVGGVRVTETAIDLPVLLAVVSSLRDKPLPQNWVAFGEVGLAGEIRPVQGGHERLKEAQKHGFRHAIVPRLNAPKHALPGIEVIPASRLDEALAIMQNHG